jgi:hypothetical protein
LLTGFVVQQEQLQRRRNLIMLALAQRLKERLVGRDDGLETCSTS